MVTALGRRRHQKIDGRPSGQVYAEWTAGAVPACVDGSHSILVEATLWRLGRATHHVAGVPFHLLAHPATGHAEGSIELFAALERGDRLWQLTGAAECLAARAGRVAAEACPNAQRIPVAALLVYCSSYMVALRDCIDEVHVGIASVLGDIPWIAISIFDEQGGARRRQVPARKPHGLVHRLRRAAG